MDKLLEFDLEGLDKVPGSSQSKSKSVNPELSRLSRMAGVYEKITEM